MARTTPWVAERRQRRVGLGRRLLHEVVGVVDERDVHPVEPEPLQALLQAAPHAVPAVVADPGQRRDAVEPLVALDVPGGGHQQPADLGGHGELVPRVPGQERAEPPLGHADAVVRRGVEGPDARGPGRGQRRGGRLLADRGEEPGDGRGAEHERAGDQGGEAAGSRSDLPIAPGGPRRVGELRQRLRPDLGGRPGGPRARGSGRRSPRRARRSARAGGRSTRACGPAVVPDSAT